MKSIFKRNKKDSDASIYKKMVALDVYYKSEEKDGHNHFISGLILKLTDLGYHISTVHSEVEETYEDFCKNINKKDFNSGLIISDSNSPESVFYVRHSSTLSSMTFWFEYSHTRLDNIVNVTLKSPFLYFASLYSQYDNKWENEKHIIVYERNKKSLKGKKYTNDIFDKRCIDVSFNYGRTEKINNIGFTAGWKVWFGAEFPSDLKTKLISLNSVRLNENDGITEIQLFDDLISVDYEKNRPIQKQFLELIKTTYNNK
tara:strand:+ start:50 stop:823 length:774 start_codon:yes stop_codon:yes gene_type:complete